MYIKQRSRIRRERVKQRAELRQIELNERRARGAKYPKFIDLALPSANEDDSDIQMIHDLSNETTHIVSDPEYPNYMDGTSPWTPDTHRPSTSHSASSQSSVQILLSYVPSQQYAASAKGTKKKQKKSKMQRPKPRSFPPRPPTATKQKSKSPRLTKAGNYLMYLSLYPTIIQNYIIYNCKWNKSYDFFLLFVRINKRITAQI